MKTILTALSIIAILLAITAASAKGPPKPTPANAPPLILLEDMRGSEVNEGCVFKLLGETDTHIAVSVHWCGQHLLEDTRVHLLRKDDFAYVSATPLLEQLK